MNKTDESNGVSYKMRKNELTSLDELKSQYTGVWAPSDGHWFGLDFRYNGIEYRLHTGSMYEANETTDEDGIIHQFGLYRKSDKVDPEHPDFTLYELLDEKASLDDLLDSTAIEGIAFRDIIMSDDTILLGQD